jgi:hypothetical protein
MINAGEVLSWLAESLSQAEWQSAHADLSTQFSEQQQGNLFVSDREWLQRPKVRLVKSVRTSDTVGNGSRLVNEIARCGGKHRYSLPESSLHSLGSARLLQLAADQTPRLQHQ